MSLFLDLFLGRVRNRISIMALWQSTEPPSLSAIVDFSMYPVGTQPQQNATMKSQ